MHLPTSECLVLPNPHSNIRCSFMPAANPDICKPNRTKTLPVAVIVVYSPCINIHAVYTSILVHFQTKSTPLCTISSISTTKAKQTEHEEAKRNKVTQTTTAQCSGSRRSERTQGVHVADGSEASRASLCRRVERSVVVLGLRSHLTIKKVDTANHCYGLLFCSLYICKT